jgi:hypothetical protein
MFSTIQNIFGIQNAVQTVGFEDVLFATNKPDNILLINTMLFGEQDCLIKTTVPIEKEEQMINNMITNYCIHKTIIIYGKNSCDKTVETKYKQMRNLGFRQTYIYYGGLFEWLLLQDIYGNDNFQTTQQNVDMLKYRPKSVLNISLLSY